MAAWSRLLTPSIWPGRQSVVNSRMKQDGLRFLNPNEKAALAEFVRRLRAKYADQVVLVRLFGSKARGDFDAESDIDVLVVVKNSDWRFREQVVGEAFEPTLAYGSVISPTVVGLHHFQWLQQHRAPLYREVQRDGVGLWTKTPARLFTSA